MKVCSQKNSLQAGTGVWLPRHWSAGPRVVGGRRLLEARTLPRGASGQSPRVVWQTGPGTRAVRRLKVGSARFLRSWLLRGSS